DAGDVAELERAADRAADVDFVDIDTDARIDRRGRVELADAADEYDRGRGVARELARRLELHARRDPLEILRLDDLALLQRLGAEGGDRDGRFLERFLAPARGDEDGIALPVRLLGGGRCRVLGG